MTALVIAFDGHLRFSVTLGGDETEPVTHTQRARPPNGDIVSSLFELSELFADREALLLRVAEWRLRLRTRPYDERSVRVELVGTGDDVRASAIVTKERVCSELLSAARGYQDWVCEGDLTTEACHCLELSVGIDDASERLRLHRQHGSQDRHEPTMDTEQIETFARHRCFRDRIYEYVLRTDALKPFVRDLTTRDDDELALACYRNLLEYEEELARPTAEVLAEHPDERAREPLTGARWSFLDAEETMVAALDRLPDE